MPGQDSVGVPGNICHGDYIEKYPAARSAGTSGDSPHLYRIQHPPGRLVEGHIGIPCSVRERLGRSRNVSQGLG